jgi:mannose-6-phosphate isomerase-like protein (cupin superfamily)
LNCRHGNNATNKKYERMPKLIDSPTVIEAAGNKPKRIEEYVGKVNTGTPEISMARMTSPCGWIEPGQTPEFQEITYVISGELHVEHTEGILRVRSGQTIVTEPNEWVRYSTPTPEGAEYIAVCLPAFSPDAVHRDQ